MPKEAYDSEQAMSNWQVILVLIAMVVAWLHGSLTGYQVGYEKGKSEKP